VARPGASHRVVCTPDSDGGSAARWSSAEQLVMRTVAPSSEVLSCQVGGAGSGSKTYAESVTLAVTTVPTSKAVSKLLGAKDEDECKARSDDHISFLLQKETLGAPLGESDHHLICQDKTGSGQTLECLQNVFFRVSLLSCHTG
jgi:hypothetical protein